MRVFDYECSNGHTYELFVRSAADCVTCPECGTPSARLLAAPRVKLEGCSGAFPGAALAWDRKREQKLAVEKQKMRDHGAYA